MQSWNQDSQFKKFIVDTILKLNKRFNHLLQKFAKCILKAVNQLITNTLMTIKSYIMKRFNKFFFKDRQLKKRKPMYKSIEKIIIFIQFVANVEALRIKTYNHFKKNQSKETVVKIEENFYKNAIYWVKICTTFSTLTKINMKTNLKLIAVELYKKKWDNSVKLRNLYIERLKEIVNFSSKCRHIKSIMKKDFNFKSDIKFLIFNNYDVVTFIMYQMRIHQNLFVDIDTTRKRVKYVND